jgi:hypothetical protein
MLERESRGALLSEYFYAFGGFSSLRDVAHDLVPEQPFRLFDAALQIPDGFHFGQVDADGDQGLRVSEDRPVTITVAPIRREASTVCTK